MLLMLGAPSQIMWDLAPAIALEPHQDQDPPPFRPLEPTSASENETSLHSRREGQEDHWGWESRDWQPLTLANGQPPEVPAYQACASSGSSNAGSGPTVGWLWSFPGSGNTVTRLLVDAASGLLTGSVYDDESLAAGLPGELLDATSRKIASERLTFVKTHTFGNGALRLGQPGLLPPSSHWPLVKRAAALTREPYAAILAEYARQTTDCHTCVLRRIDNWTDFEAKSVQLASMWRAINEKQLHCVNGFATSPSNAYSCGHAKLVKLEDLLLADDRLEHLRALLAFAGVEASDERLRCAYEHAEMYHRTGSLTVPQTFCSDHVRPGLLSELAAILEPGAAKLGYSPLDCSAVAEHQKEIYSLPP